jgi:hypothetical protein
LIEVTHDLHLNEGVEGLDTHDSIGVHFNNFFLVGTAEAVRHVHGRHFYGGNTFIVV